jgi:hypothetical protein
MPFARPTSLLDNRTCRRHPSVRASPLGGTAIAALVLLAALAFTVRGAHADIYTWTDASGSINVSNIAPPDDVHVTKVVHDSPPRPQAAIDAAEAAHQAEVRALNDRVGQLERDADVASRVTSRAPAYPPPGAYPPQPPVYAATAPTPAIQYSVYPPESTAQGCDSSWNDCGNNWLTSPIYAAPFFVVQNNPFRRRPFPGRRFPPHTPVNHPIGGMGVVQPPLGATGVVAPPTGVVIPNTWPVQPLRSPAAGSRRH